MYGVTPTIGVLFTWIVLNTPQQFPEDLTAVPSGDQSSWANWAFFRLFLKTNRSISANAPRIRHRFEPALKSRGITLRKTWCTQAGLTLSITLGFCVWLIAPPKEHLIQYRAADTPVFTWEPRSFATKPPSVPPSSF